MIHFQEIVKYLVFHYSVTVPNVVYGVILKYYLI